MNTMNLLGSEFRIDWQSGDGRQFANRETLGCWELESFEYLAADDERTLRKQAPTQIEKCWIPNPNYSRSPERELLEWHRVTNAGFGSRRQHEAPQLRGYYYPPEAVGLRFIEPTGSDLGDNFPASLRTKINLTLIIKNEFHIPFSGPLASSFSKPGLPAFIACFRSGEVLLLKAVSARELPSEAKQSWQIAELLKTTKELRDATDSRMQETAARLRRAEATAAENLEEAMQKWLHFDPPRMGRETKSRIQEAVRLYVTNGDMRSLRRIAKQFHVTAKTVSGWFKTFFEHTGYPVVTHRHHESVKGHLRSEQDLGQARARKRTR